MFRYRRQALVIVVTCATLATVFPLARTTYSQNIDGSSAARSDAATRKAGAPIPTSVVPEKGTAVSDEAVTRTTGNEGLKRRAGEQIGDRPKGGAIMLGMTLQEANNGRVKVVEVGTTSPAFDAGVHEGDEILSYQGFRADSYRKWIDGMRRLTTDAPANSRIPLVVLREGKRFALQIRVPVTPVRPTDRALATQKTSQQQQVPGAGGLAAPIPPGPAGGQPVGGNNIAIDNAGPFGDISGDPSASANERAMAQIVRVNVPPQTTPAGASPAANPNSQPAAVGAGQQPSVGAAAPAGGGTRIGLAGFRDDPNGMVVMVDVGALPPGNYTVAITDPSVMGGSTGTGGATPNGANVDAPSPQPPSLPRAGSGDQPVPSQNPAIAPPVDAAPAEPAAPAGVGTPQSNLSPTSGGSVPRTVLAQVAATGQADSSSNADPGAAAAAGTPPDAIVPPTGQTPPETTPTAAPTGQVSPSNITPTGPSANSGQPNQAAQTATGVGQTDTGLAGRNGVGGTTLNEIGTLTVDQSGTGRLQQTVEGVKVRTVVGQAIVLYATAVPPQTALPANLNEGPGAATRQGISDSTSARGSQGAVSSGQGGAAGARTPVAAGIIRLVSDRRPPATGPETGGSPAGVNSGVEQPAAAATPPTGQNPVR